MSSAMMSLAFALFETTMTRSRAFLRIESSVSLTHSRITVRCRLSAWGSSESVVCMRERLTYLMLLSLYPKNLPKMFTAKTRSPLLPRTLMIVRTHSYRMAFPAPLPPSTLVATWARMSLIESPTLGSPSLSRRSKCKIFTCRYGSETPPTSYSAANPPEISTLSTRHSKGTHCAKTARNTRSVGVFRPSLVTMSIINVTPVSTTAWLRSLSCWMARSANGSIRSGHRWIIRRAHSAAFFLRYGFPDESSLSTSGERSLAISAEQMFPSAVRASPLTY